MVGLNNPNGAPDLGGQSVNSPHLSNALPRTEENSLRILLDGLRRVRSDIMKQNEGTADIQPQAPSSSSSCPQVLVSSSSGQPHPQILTPSGSGQLCPQNLTVYSPGQPHPQNLNVSCVGQAPQIVTPGSGQPQNMVVSGPGQPHHQILTQRSGQPYPKLLFPNVFNHPQSSVLPSSIQNQPQPWPANLLQVESGQYQPPHLVQGISGAPIFVQKLSGQPQPPPGHILLPIISNQAPSRPPTFIRLLTPGITSPSFQGIAPGSKNTDDVESSKTVPSSLKDASLFSTPTASPAPKLLMAPASVSTRSSVSSSKSLKSNALPKELPLVQKGGNASLDGDLSLFLNGLTKMMSKASNESNANEKDNTVASDCKDNMGAAVTTTSSTILEGSNSSKILDLCNDSSTEKTGNNLAVNGNDHMDVLKQEIIEIDDEEEDCRLVSVDLSKRFFALKNDLHDTVIDLSEEEPTANSAKTIKLECDESDSVLDNDDCPLVTDTTVDNKLANILHDEFDNKQDDGHDSDTIDQTSQNGLPGNDDSSIDNPGQIAVVGSTTEKTTISSKCKEQEFAENVNTEANPSKFQVLISALGNVFHTLKERNTSSESKGSEVAPPSGNSTSNNVDTHWDQKEKLKPSAENHHMATDVSKYSEPSNVPHDDDPPEIHRFETDISGCSEPMDTSNGDEPPEIEQFKSVMQCEERGENDGDESNEMHEKQGSLRRGGRSSFTSGSESEMTANEYRRKQSSDSVESSSKSGSSPHSLNVVNVSQSKKKFTNIKKAVSSEETADTGAIPTKSTTPSSKRGVKRKVQSDPQKGNKFQKTEPEVLKPTGANVPKEITVNNPQVSSNYNLRGFDIVLEKSSAIENGLNLKSGLKSNKNDNALDFKRGMKTSEKNNGLDLKSSMKSSEKDIGLDLNSVMKSSEKGIGLDLNSGMKSSGKINGLNLKSDMNCSEKKSESDKSIPDSTKSQKKICDSVKNVANLHAKGNDKDKDIKPVNPTLPKSTSVMFSESDGSSSSDSDSSGNSSHSTITDSSEEDADVEYKCKLCSRSFQRKSALKKHMKKMHHKGQQEKGVRKISCKACRRKFSDKTALQAHLLKRRYCFFDCSRIYWRKDSTKACKMCGKTVSKWKDLKKHSYRDLICRLRFINLILDNMKQRSQDQLDNSESESRPNVVQGNQNLQENQMQNIHILENKHEKDFSTAHCCLSTNQNDDSGSTSIENDADDHEASEGASHHLKIERQQRLKRGCFYTCKSCQQQFKAARLFRSHLNLSNYASCKTYYLNPSNAFPVALYFCPGCSKFKESQFKLINHQCREKCEVCNEMFSNGRALQTHLRSSNCGTHYPKIENNEKGKPEITASSSTLKVAIDSPALASHSSLPRMPFEQEKCPCLVCNVVFSQIQDLLDHSHKHFEEKEYVCKDCGMAFNRYNGLVSHEIWHKRKSKLTHENTNQRLPVSLKKEASIQPLISEVVHSPHHPDQPGLNSINSNTVITDRTLKCPYCPIRFQIKANYTLHVLKHSESKTSKLIRYKCTLCSSKILKYSFRKHLKSHKNRLLIAIKEGFKSPISADNTALCSICNKTFTSKKGIVKHLKQHTPMDIMMKITDPKKVRVSPFQYDQGKSTSQQQNACDDGSGGIPTNRKIAKMTTNFSCDQCDKKFSSLAAFKFHLKVSHKSVKQEIECGYNGGAQNVKKEIDSIKKKGTQSRKRKRSSTALHSRVCEICHKVLHSSSVTRHMVRIHGLAQELFHIRRKSFTSNPSNMVVKSERNVTKTGKKDSSVSADNDGSELPRIQVDDGGLDILSNKDIDNEDLPDDQSSLYCSVCNGSFSSKKHLWQHQFVHIKPCSIMSVRVEEMMSQVQQDFEIDIDGEVNFESSPTEEAGNGGFSTIKVEVPDSIQNST